LLGCKWTSCTTIEDEGMEISMNSGITYKDKISVIVPIYNAEKYLKQCIESITCQTYEDLEIVLVDDGSTDCSYDICMAYAKTDSRIKLVHMDNGGEASARKEGMKASSGMVITFVDSDDWIEPDTIEKLYTEMEVQKADIVVTGYTEVFGEKEKTVWNNLAAGVYRGEQLEKDVFPVMLCCTDYFELGLCPYLWNKMFRREIIEPCILSLNENLVVGVDAVCTFPAFLKAGTVSIIQGAFYHYRIHQSSIMHRFRSEKEEVENIKIQYGEMKRIFSNSAYSEVLLPQMNRYILHHFMVRAGLFLERKLKAEGVSFLEEMQEGSKVVLYGAGAFGVSLYYANEQSGCFSVTGWCDRDYKERQAMGYPVISAEEALKQEFDYILIAVLSQRTREQIQKYLSLRGIEGKRIKWLNTATLDQINLEESVLWQEPLESGHRILGKLIRERDKNIKLDLCQNSMGQF